MKLANHIALGQKRDRTDGNWRVRGRVGLDSGRSERIGTPIREIFSSHSSNARHTSRVNAHSAVHLAALT